MTSSVPRAETVEGGREGGREGEEFSVQSTIYPGSPCRYIYEVLGVVYLCCGTLQCMYPGCLLLAT